MKYLIFSDASCDVEAEIVERYGVRFIPMEYSIGDVMHVCEGKESADVLKRLYDGQRRGDLTRTTQINPYTYIDKFTPFIKQGQSIIYLALSSGLSDTCKSACNAKKVLKEQYPEADVFVVDTLGATCGMGVLVERACRNRENGMSAEDNYNDLVAATKNIRHWFMVQDLMYLKRGGRISGATAVIGSMLNIRPILKVNESGRLETVEKKRGNNGALNALFEKFRESYDDSSGDSVYVADADAKELGDSLAETIEKAFPGVKVKRSMFSPIIGAHTGPGVVIVCYMGKDKQ